MSLNKLLLPAAAALLLAGPALADGGPVPEPPPPPPPAEPAPEPEPAPPPPPAPAAFEPSIYVEGEGGVAFAGNLNYGCCEFEMETGYNAGGAFGVHVSPNWDVEMEGFFARMGYGGCATICNDTDFETHLSGLSAMVNVIYNFDMGWGVDPYIGVGAGATRIHYDGGEQFPIFTGSDWNFGYQVMAGGMMDITEHVGLFMEYRFHDVTKDATIVGVPNIEYRSHNVSLGVQLTF